MSIDIVRSIITVTLFVLFVALCVWAWSSRRRADFEAAALLPFDDDDELAALRSARNGDTPHLLRTPQAEAAAGNEACSHSPEEAP